LSVCQLLICETFLEVHINTPEVPNQLLRYFGTCLGLCLVHLLPSFKIAKIAEDLNSSSESDLEAADQTTESSDWEVNSESTSPVVLKSISALSKVHPDSSRLTSPRSTPPVPQYQVTDGSLTGSLGSVTIDEFRLLFV